jgi:hypothetical protein
MKLSNQQAQTLKKIARAEYVIFDKGKSMQSAYRTETVLALVRFGFVKFHPYPSKNFPDRELAKITDKGSEYLQCTRLSFSF